MYKERARLTARSQRKHFRSQSGRGLSVLKNKKITSNTYRWLATCASSSTDSCTSILRFGRLNPRIRRRGGPNGHPVYRQGEKRRKSSCRRLDYGVFPASVYENAVTAFSDPPKSRLSTHREWTWVRSVLYSKPNLAGTRLYVFRSARELRHSTEIYWFIEGA